MKTKHFLTFLLLMSIFKVAAISEQKETKAIVTLKDGVIIVVKQPRIEYWAPGTYLGDHPKRTDDKIYYSINIHNVSIQKIISFSEIRFMEFKKEIEKNFVTLESIEITLKDRRKIVISSVPAEIIEISSKGEKQTYKPGVTMAMFGFSMMKGEGKYEGDYWEGRYFIGKAVIEGQEGDFEASVDEINRIEFE